MEKNSSFLHFHHILLCFYSTFYLLILGCFGDIVSKNNLKIVFNEEARNWTDALPIGNGCFGAMVHGSVFHETINLNEDTLWTGIPGQYTDPSARKALTTVRKLVDEGNYSEATVVADKELSGVPSDVYQLLGDLKLDFEHDNSGITEETYHRELDLDTATITIRYSVGDTEFTREHFASNPDQAIVSKFSSNKNGSLNFNAYLDSRMTHVLLSNSENQIIMIGTCPGKRNPPHAEDDPPTGILFSLVLNLQVGGENALIHRSNDQKLRVKYADWAVIRLVSSSSFAGPFTKPSDSRKDPTVEALNTMNSIKNLPYSTLYSRHLDDYQKLFHRVSLKLSKSSNSDTVPTAERVRSFITDEDPSLVELLFQYGRYLLISSSRTGSQPSNLQGIWNKEVDPPWDCSPHLNINLQMNYWPSLPCNLHETQEPLFDYMASLATNGRKTAKVN